MAVVVLTENDSRAALGCVGEQLDGIICNRENDGSSFPQRECVEPPVQFASCCRGDYPLGRVMFVWAPCCFVVCFGDQAIKIGEIDSPVSYASRKELK